MSVYRRSLKIQIDFGLRIEGIELGPRISQARRPEKARIYTDPAPYREHRNKECMHIRSRQLNALDTVCALLRVKWLEEEPDVG